MKEKDIFSIRPTNEEQNDFIITVGRHLATLKHFKTKEEAEKYLKEFHWDTTIAVMAEMNSLLESKLRLEKPTMVNNGINKEKHEG